MFWVVGWVVAIFGLALGLAMTRMRSMTDPRNEMPYTDLGLAQLSKIFGIYFILLFSLGVAHINSTLTTAENLCILNKSNPPLKMMS